MNGTINGEIVPALGQWQGLVLIAATLTVAYLLRQIRGSSRSS